MSRKRDRREAKAIEFLRSHQKASALEIGAAAVKGEPWVGRHSWKAKEGIGLSIAVALTRAGIVKPTRGNQFEITR